MNRLISLRALSGASLAWAISSGNVLAMPADKLYAALSPSVWRVFTFDAKGDPLGQGSAVVVGRETLLTNCHVLRKAKSFIIKQDNQSFGAKLELIDHERDLCQIRARGLSSPAVKTGNSDKLVVGQKIYTLGAPRGLELTLSDGLISALRKDDSANLKTIQISAPIAGGSSGGGLFDEEGKLIGITYGGIRDIGNLNLALPINWMQELPSRSAMALSKYREQANGSKPATQTGIVAAEPMPAVQASPAPPPSATYPSATQPSAAVPSSAQPPATQALAGQSATGPAQAAGLPAHPSASGYADLNDIGKLDQFGVRKGYEDFLRAPLPRAFAFTADGRWWNAWGLKPKNPDSPKQPHLRIVPDCERHYQTRCYLYAVNNEVVYRPDAAQRQ